MRAVLIFRDGRRREFTVTVPTPTVQVPVLEADGFGALVFRLVSATDDEGAVYAE